MATTVERERKYAASGDFRTPDLTGCGGISSVSDAAEHDLDAVYLDTGDLRLARGGYALRRRTGGHDAGWHLKVGAAGGDRVEHQYPLGPDDGNPPEELVVRYRAAARGGPVAPAARVRNRRAERQLCDDAGRVLALLAEDTVEAADLVTGERQSWREIEVELVDGDAPLLDAVHERLRAAGARESTVSKSQRALGTRLAAACRPAPVDPAAAPVVAYALAQRDALVAHHPGARDGDEEAVHDMRVAARRLRTTLRTFRGLWDRTAGAALRDELRWLGTALGPVRDGQVMGARLSAAVHAEPADLVLGPVAARIDRHVAAEFAEASARLDEVLDSARFTDLLTALDRLVEGPPVRSVGDRWVTRRIRRAVERADGLLDRALDRRADGPDPGGDTALHEARKAYKRARYAVEVRQPENRRAEALVGRLKELQDLLGAHQDTVVTRDLLRRLATAAFTAGENSFTYGLLHARQAAEAERAIRAVPKARDRTRRPRVRRWLG